MQNDIRGPRERATMEALEAELDNLRAAFDWALEEDPIVALRMAGTWWFFGSRGHENEIARWAEAALAAGPDEPSAERSGALRSLAFNAFWRGDPDTMLSRAECKQTFDKYIDLTLASDSRFEGIPPEMITQLKEQALSQAQSQKGDPCSTQEVTRELIDVEVTDGWVTLRGVVSWQFESDAAYEDVANLFGVIGITNEILVVNP